MLEKQELLLGYLDVVVNTTDTILEINKVPTHHPDIVLTLYHWLKNLRTLKK